MWKGTKDWNFREFGCIAYPLERHSERKKLDVKAEKFRFVGYGTTTKSYRLYDENKHKILIKRDVTFNEKDFGHENSKIRKDAMQCEAIAGKWVLRNKQNADGSVVCWWPYYLPHQWKTCFASNSSLQVSLKWKTWDHYHYCLGITVDYSSDGQNLFIHQKQYIQNLLTKQNMKLTKSISPPAESRYECKARSKWWCKQTSWSKTVILDRRDLQLLIRPVLTCMRTAVFVYVLMTRYYRILTHPTGFLL